MAKDKKVVQGNPPGKLGWFEIKKALRLDKSLVGWIGIVVVGIVILAFSTTLLKNVAVWLPAVLAIAAASGVPIVRLVKEFLRDNLDKIFEGGFLGGEVKDLWRRKD